MTEDVLAEIDAMNQQTRKMVQQSLDRPLEAVLVPMIVGTAWAFVVIVLTATATALCFT